MIANDFLYYYEKQNNEIFSHTPPGTPNIHRLITGETKFWKKTALTTERKPKNLIIADWTAMLQWNGSTESYSDSLVNIEDIIHCFDGLLKQNFKLFLWQNGKVISLGKEHLDCLYEEAVRREITPAHFEHIITIAVNQHHLTRDAIHILDRYWISVLLENAQELPPRYITKSDLVYDEVDEEHEFDIQNYIDILRQAVPSVTAGIIPPFSPPYARDPFKAAGLLVQETYTRFTLNEQVIDYLQRAEVEGFTSHLENVQYCTISFLREDQLEFAADCLDKMANLLFLKLDALKWQKPLQPPSEKKHLKVLKIQNSAISAENIQSLLNNAPRLERMNLWNSTVSSDATMEIVHPGLEKLIIEEGTRAPHIHFSFENLEVLDFKCSDITTMGFVPTLRTVKLGSFRWSPEYLLHLFTSSPHMETVTLTDFEFMSQETLPMFELKQLKELILISKTHGRGSKELLLSILRATSTLTLLHLGSFEQLSPRWLETHFPALHLRDITSLTISDMEMSYEGLSILLTFLPNLSTLVLCSVDFSDDEHVPQVSHLKKLTLESTNLSQTILQAMISQTTALSTLVIKDCKDLDGAFPVPFVSRENVCHLKEFCLSDSNLSFLACKSILQSAENLESLTLQKWDYTDSSSFLDVSFPKLLTLDLQELNDHVVSFTEENLRILLASSSLNSLILCGFNLTSVQDSLNFPLLNQLVLLQCVYDPVSLKTIRKNSPYVVSEEIQSSITFEQSDIKFLSGSSAFVPKKMDSTLSCDADTRHHPDKTFQLQRIFYEVGSETGRHLHPRDYRMAIFQEVRCNEKLCRSTQAPFTFIKHEDPQWVQSNATLIAQDLIVRNGEWMKSLFPYNRYFCGVTTLSLTPEWQALPSVSPNEKILNFSLDQEVPVEIQYSLRDSQYYVRSLEMCSVEFRFLIEITPRKEPALKVIEEIIPQRYAIVENPQVDIAEELKQFGVGALQLDGLPLSGEGYMRAIFEQKVGACRHRAAVFMWLMRHRFPEIPVRIVTNGCHAFVEVKADGAWHVYDLGGYPANCIIQDYTSSTEQTHEAITAEMSTEHERSTRPEEVSIENELSIRTAYYQKRLQTWEMTERSIESAKDYTQALLAPGGGHKKLILSVTENSSYALILQLEMMAQDLNRPLFYIHSPEDLVCRAPFIERTGYQGFLKKAPGGRLYDFLMQPCSSASPPVLLVNYSSFATDDLVRLNRLLDKERFIDDVRVPEELVVLGVMNINKRGSYQGADFIGRFDQVEKCPLSLHHLEEHLPYLPPPMEQQEMAVFSINLYQDEDWEKYLLGHWVLEQGNLYFEKGQLSLALDSGKPICIQNAPWHNEKFMLFWRRAMIKRQFEYETEIVPLPDAVQFYSAKGYDWEALLVNTHWDREINADSLILNPGQMEQLFQRYQCDNVSRTLVKLPGIIALHKDKLLEMILTRALNENEWAKVLASCQKHQVTVCIHVLPGVNLPDPLCNELYESVSSLPEEWDRALDSLADGQVMVSTDPAVSVVMLQQEFELVFEVTECEVADLISRLDGYLTDEMAFEFMETETALFLALKDNKSVILTGNFSPELVDGLAAFLYNRFLRQAFEHESQPSKVLVVCSSADMDYFTFLPRIMHRVKQGEKKLALTQLEPAYQMLGDQSQIDWNEPLNKIRACLRHLHMNTSDDPWAGFEKVEIKYPLMNTLKERESLLEAETFCIAQVQAVWNGLQHAPYLFLTGPTGAGKSTLVLQELSRNARLHIGELRTRDWALDTFDGLKILFIDEANLCERQWSEFEGLFHKSPGILHQGRYYPLTRQHKVIFAGNPANYGAGRKCSPFFLAHGGAKVFQPLPASVIYQKILKPVFTGTRLEGVALEISYELLKIYQFFLSISQDEILMSPRELQMMALLVWSYYEHYPEERNYSDIARFYAIQLAHPLVPKINYEAFLKTCLTLEREQPKRLRLDLPQEFLLTPSRQGAGMLVCDLLLLRELRQVHLKNEHRFGGLGGIILEGPPGIGKSELVTACLIAHGFTEVSDLNSATKYNKSYYRLPLSLSLFEKEQILLQAFDEGAVVIIDEINSSPMLERLLNDLLMGKKPDGTFPMNPGFMIIGTQNPVTMAGRQRLSTALARRLIRIDLPEYDSDELLDILRTKGLSNDEAKPMVEAFCMQVEHALTRHLKPVPTLRDLLKLADEHATEQKHDAQPDRNAKRARTEEQGRPLRNLSLFGANESNDDSQVDPRQKRKRTGMAIT